MIAGRAADESGEPRTAVFEYRDGALELGLYLPSGRDTGYSGLYAVSGNEVLIACYSGHEYPDSDKRVTHGPCDIYLASVSL